jgi:hypothetical protein
MEGFKQNLDSASEQESLDVEKGMERERTILGKFQGKAKGIARSLLFVSALSAGYGFEGHTSEAGETEQDNKSAHSQEINADSQKEELFRRFADFRNRTAEGMMELKNLQDVMGELNFLYQQHKENDVAARSALESWILSKTGRAKNVDPKVRYSILNELSFRTDKFVQMFLTASGQEYSDKDIAIQRESLVKNHAAFRQLRQMQDEALEMFRFR